MNINNRTFILIVLPLLAIALAIGFKTGTVYAVSTCTLSSTVATCTGASASFQDLTFTSEADSSAAGKFFLSSTTANTLKYYDTQATPVLHSLAALDLGQTWTGAQTFGADIAASTDNARSIGTATTRFLQAAFSSNIRIFAASGDANPTSSLESGVLKLGGGGAATMDESIIRLSIGSVPGLAVQSLASAQNTAFSILPTTTANRAQISIWRTSDTVTDYEQLAIGSEVQTTNEFDIQITKGGTGTLRPLVFYIGTTEVFRIQIASPYLKFNEGTTGSGTFGTGTNCPAVTCTAPYTWIKVASADGSTVYIPAYK